MIALARIIDRLTAAIGRAAAWFIPLAVALSVCNALLRYGAHFAQQVLLDLPLVLFACIVLGAAPRTLAEDSHIRVDLLYRKLSDNGRAIVDLFGHVFFLMPLCILMIFDGGRFFWRSFEIMEGPSTPGGLPQWPAKALIPLAFVLLLLQSVSQIAKALAVLGRRGAATKAGV